MELHNGVNKAERGLGTSPRSGGCPPTTLPEKTNMTKFALLGAAAFVATALSGPAMAQQVISNPGYCAQFYPNANCQNKGPGNPYSGDDQRQAAYRHANASMNGNDSYARRDSWNEPRESRYDSGFWPANEAAAVAGAAVGTAGAIVTAPDGAYGDNRVYNNGYPMGGESYAKLNGFLCIPGTVFKGEDGRPHLCQ
jgi:hypothetical protein